MHFPFLAVPVMLPLRQLQMQNKCNTSQCRASQQLSSHRGQRDVKVWDGHETWYPSVLLLADEEGLWLVDKWLFKICKKGEQLLKRRKKLGKRNHQ